MHASKLDSSGLTERSAVLYVDDRGDTRSFQTTFGISFRVLTASSALEGLAILEQEKLGVGVLMVDWNLTDESGFWLLERALQINPHLVNVMCTAYRREWEPFIHELDGLGVRKHALQRTRPSRRGCNRSVPQAGSLSLGR
jgi:hypothetical protein